MKPAHVSSVLAQVSSLLIIYLYLAAYGFYNLFYLSFVLRTLFTGFCVCFIDTCAGLIAAKV